jgi:hypothetical protein
MFKIKLTGVSLIIFSIIFLTRCATLLPPSIKLESKLTPIVNEGEERYTLEEDGAISYNLDGLKISVKPMTDEKLNKMFPENSYQEEASTNPYTYGNWVDLDLGYTPNRFTVFLIKVFNYAQPKVNLDPLTSVLTTNRGATLLPYARGQKDNPGNERNFESYYEKIKGSSGVERIRFEERLGLIRQTLFTEGQIFKGDKKDGFIVFDPLDESVKEVELKIIDFVFKYDSNNWPQEKINISFTFNRELNKIVEKKEKGK